MFKILVLQELYSLLDDAAEFQIKDRLSFQRFLVLGLDGTVPDATTVWLFCERLVKVKEGADPKAAKPVELPIQMFGYKNQIGIDRAHGLIRSWDTSAANAHDGAQLPGMVS